MGLGLRITFDLAHKVLLPKDTQKCEDLYNGKKGRKEDKFPFKIWHFKMAERATEPWRVLPLCQIPARAAHWTSGLSQLNQNVRTQKPHHKLCLLKSRYIILLVLLSIGLLQSCACLCVANGGMPSLFSFRENLY